MSRKEEFLKLENITVSFARWGQTVQALVDVNLTVPQGQWVLLVGPNGSGKTTLLRVVSSRTLPDRGNVLLNGFSVEKMTPLELAQHVFHVHQDPLLGTAPSLTLFENLWVADHQADVERESRHLLGKKYTEMLKPFGLADRLRQQAHTLSGGERALLALLIARLRLSSLVLLDEPLAALDPSKTKTCLAEIERLSAMGKTIIHVTHDPNQLTSLGDRTVVLKEGKIVFDEVGASRYQADFIHPRNIVHN
ncbi:ATP-binding cassette domain-containing protein [Nitrospinota bacterium]